MDGIKFRSVFSLSNPNADYSLRYPEKLEFDYKNNRFLIFDFNNSQVIFLSAKDGSYLGKIQVYQNTKHKHCSVIDYVYNRIIIIKRNKIKTYSLNNFSFLSKYTFSPSHHLLAYPPIDAVIDEKRQQIIILTKRRLEIFSLADFSLIESIEKENTGMQSGKIKIDQENDCLIIDDFHGTYSSSSGYTYYGMYIYILSLSTRQYMRSFYESEREKYDCSFNCCIANQGRIITASRNDSYLQAFTQSGQLISTFYPHDRNFINGISFDPLRGLIAYSTDSKVFIIEANQWLPNTFIWSPNTHRFASKEIKNAIKTLMMLRSLDHDSLYPSVILLPNELLFEIFCYL